MIIATADLEIRDFKARIRTNGIALVPTKPFPFGLASDGRPNKDIRDELKRVALAWNRGDTGVPILVGAGFRRDLSGRTDQQQFGGKLGFNP